MSVFSHLWKPRHCMTIGHLQMTDAHCEIQSERDQHPGSLLNNGRCCRY